MAYMFFGNVELSSLCMVGFARKKAVCYDPQAMKHKFWIALVTCLDWCIDRELYKAIDHLREHVRVLVELQEQQNKRIRIIPSQRMRV